MAADPAKPVGPAALVPATPAFDFSRLDAAVARLKAAAVAYDAVVDRNGGKLDSTQLGALDEQLLGIDQLLLDGAGLPGRPWYQHLLHAPGRFTGYEAKTMPGVREAIEERRFEDADVYIGRTAKVLNDYAERLELARTTAGP